jgi:preprotein translocase subunit YajC
MQFRILVHSIVDVITNSSSVIYTEAHDNSIKVAKEIINAVLKASGSDKKADDLFNFRIQKGTDDLCDFIQRMVDDEDEDALARIPNLDAYKASQELTNKKGEPDYNAQVKAYEKWENENQEALNHLFDDEEANTETGIHANLIVTTKDGVEIDFARKALAMFDISESYN